MPSGDPRQATVITTWFPRGDEIYFDETGQYQTVLQGSNCTASVRRTRVLKRVVATPKPEPLADEQKTAQKEEPQEASKTEEPAPVEKAVPSTAPPPPPTRSSHCAKTGKAVSLEVTPKTKLMRVGESFAFQAIARDQSGCRAAVSTTWKLLSGEGGSLAPDGTITVPKDANPGTLTIEAQVDDRSVTVTARVVTDAEYEELIAGGEYGVMGESLEGASIKLSTSHVEFEALSGEGTDDNGKKKLLGIVATLLLGLGGVTFFLLSRRAPAPVPSLQEVPDEEPLAPPRADSGEAAPPPATTIRLCPSCGKRYEDGTMFCGEDGARLVRSN